MEKARLREAINNLSGATESANAKAPTTADVKTEESPSSPSQFYQCIEASEYDASKGDILGASEKGPPVYVHLRPVPATASVPLDELARKTADTLKRAHRNEYENLVRAALQVVWTLRYKFVPEPAGLDEIVEKATKNYFENWPSELNEHAAFRVVVRRACEDAIKWEQMESAVTIAKRDAEIESLLRQVATATLRLDEAKDEVRVMTNQCVQLRKELQQVKDSLRRTEADKERLDHLWKLVQDADTKGVAIGGHGCYCSINIGNKRISEGDDLREAIDEARKKI